MASEMKRLASVIVLMACTLAINAQTVTFPYPEIPSMLASPSERGAYLLEHYWDNYDFADTTLIDKPEIAEQGFANFIDLIPRLDSVAAIEGIATFGEKAFGTTTPLKVAERFETMVEHYLADPNSPMRNEDLYIHFLDAQISAMERSGGNTSRPKARMTMAMKNRRGSKSSDISFTTRTGQRSTLYATESNLLLLIFYDPACEHCSEILTMLRNDNVFNQQVADGSVRVLAVYTEGDRQLWKNTNSSLPKEWTVAIEESNVVANKIYDIPAMPIFYLLDKDKKVIMKDPSLGELLMWLKGNKNVRL